LRAKIPKAQKDTDDLTVFFALLESAHSKVAHKMLMKLTSDDERRFLFYSSDHKKKRFLLK